LTKTLAIKLPFVLQRSKDSKFAQEQQENSNNPEIQIKDVPNQTPTKHLTPVNVNKQKKQSNEV
jgi:hypothetical protein